MRRIFHLIGIATVAAGLAPAGEYAVLANGFRLHADRHEVDGARVRLFSSGGVTELPVDSVTAFEAEEPAAKVPEPASARSEPAQPAVGRRTAPADLADAAAEKFALPGAFVRSVMKAESGFQPMAVSQKGALGLMQLMPGTAKELGVDPLNPQENAEGGTMYLRSLLAKYEDDPDQVLLALAAYNAGPAAVDKYHGVPPYRETREYILRVLRNWDRPDNRK